MRELADLPVTQTGDDGAARAWADRLVQEMAAGVDALSLVDAVRQAGGAVVAQLLDRYHTATDPDVRGSIADVVARAGVRHPQILAIWLERLADEPDLAATALGEYGDPAAVAPLRAWWAACTVPTRRGPQRLEQIDAALAVVGALQDLGEPLTAADVARWDSLLELRDRDLDATATAIR